MWRDSNEWPRGQVCPDQSQASGVVVENRGEPRSLLEHNDPRERLRGARQLAADALELPLDRRAATVDLLAGLVSDPEPFVRWNLAWELGRLAHSAALPALERLSQDPHANVRFRVALALALIDDAAGLAILEHLARDSYVIGDHAVVKAFAALALGKLSGATVIHILAPLGEDGDPVVRWHAAVGLGDAGDASAVPVLLKLLGDEVPFVRAHAGIALAQIGDPRALEELRAAAAREPHDKVKGVIAKAADTLATVSSTAE